MNSNYDTRVFQIQCKGNRYGFTLAGEYPCTLVKIQSGSAADLAGLESGDEVVEVNGVNVEDLKHDNVVNFISPSKTGLTDLRIRRAAKSPNSPFQQIIQSGKGVHKSISEDVLDPPVSKIVDRVVEEFKRPSTASITSTPRLRRGVDPPVFNENDMASDEELRASFSPEARTSNISTAGSISAPWKPSMRLNFAYSSLHRTRSQSKFQAVLRYLGSIDRPMTTRGSSDLLTHLRMKGEPSVIVLLEISPMMLCLRNSSKQIIMTCPTSSLAFVGICPENQQILGLFTADINNRGRNTVSVTQGTVSSDLNLNCSCHLFVIDPRLIRHRNHELLTDRFHLRCVPDPATGSCQQFPSSSAAILNAISVLLKGSPSQITTNGSEISRNLTTSKFQVACFNLPEHVRDELCGKGPSGLTRFSSQAEQDGRQQEFVLCLHLRPLVHTGMTRHHEMERRPPGNFKTESGGINHSTMLQNSSANFTAASRTVTSSQCNNHNLVTSKSTQGNLTGKSVHKDSRKPLDKGKEIEGGHKTLINQRSQSLASNMTTTSQSGSAVQTTESYSQSGFHVGCGGRPIFHSSSVSVTTCSDSNSVEGKVAKWAVAFDRLLEDSTGVKIFRSFLQKEYSEENMIFWLACEKYKAIEDENELKKCAEDIYETHLKSSAAMLVNVENSAIREVEENLERPTNELFTALQHKVYTLMKFDSYSRFLKSELYRQCWVAEIEGSPLPLQQESKHGSFSTIKKMVKFSHLVEPEVNVYYSDSGISNLHGTGVKVSSHVKVRSWKGLKTQNSFEIEETKKRFVLPWRARLKSDQSKKTSSRGSDSQASSARSSLSSLSDSVFSSNVTNSDETLNDSDGKDQAPPSCRVILPNRSLMYLFCKSTYSLREGLSKLCEKMHYSLPSLDLFIADRRLTKKDLQKKLTRFINKEIVLKQGVLFRLQLSNDKVVGIKADEKQTIDQVLEPILRQNGLDVADVLLHLKDEQLPLDAGCSVSSLHKQHVIVEEYSGDKVRKTTDNYVEKNESNHEVLLNNNQINTAKSKEDSVFDAIMGGKRQSMSGFTFDENGVFVTLMKQAQSDESLLNDKEKQHLIRSPALFRKKKRAVTQTVSTFKTFLAEEDKNNVEELFSLLDRSQRSRMEDQRGLLDKNIELPDFLKLPNKSNKGNNRETEGVTTLSNRHPPLKNSNSSPPTYEPSTIPPVKIPSISVPAQPGPRDTLMSRNWSGSLIAQGKAQIIETQTIDRKRFFKTMQDKPSSNRSRAGSLSEERPDGCYDGYFASSEWRARSRYQYGSESTFGNKENQAVWVSTILHKNRRREPGRTDQSVGAGNKKPPENDWNSNCLKAEVIIPKTKSNGSRFPATRGVARNGERPKPIRDNSFVREYLSTTERPTPTPDDKPKARGLQPVSDREAILDNSFLRDQFKPSRLFSQISPETSTPLGSSSPAEKRMQRIQGPMKCPLFSSQDSTREDTITDTSAHENSARLREHRADSTNNSRNAYDELEEDLTRHVYWGLSEHGNEEEAAKVTFV